MVNGGKLLQKLELTTGQEVAPHPAGSYLLRRRAAQAEGVRVLLQAGATMVQ